MHKKNHGGIWCWQAFGSRGQTSLNPILLWVCVCVCALCILASQRGFTQYRPCQLEFCCSLSTQRATTPRAPSRAHALSACDGSVGSPLNSPRKKSTKGGSTFRQESTPLQPLWRLMTLVLVSVGVKKQVALRDSLHLGKIWRMEWHCSWLPDSSFVLVQPALSQMPAGEPVHVLYCKKKSSRETDSGKMT